MAVWRDRFFARAWRSGVGFIYVRESLEKIGSFSYTGEGWGLTDDGRRLIMSAGSSWLRFLDPQTQRQTGRLQIRDGGRPGAQLNELEFVKGGILANVWQTEKVVRREPET